MPLFYQSNGNLDPSPNFNLHVSWWDNRNKPVNLKIEDNCPTKKDSSHDSEEQDGKNVHAEDKDLDPTSTNSPQRGNDRDLKIQNAVNNVDSINNLANENQNVKEDSKSDSKTKKVIGIGVGIGLLLVGIVLTIICLKCKRSDDRKAARDKKVSVDVNPMYGDEEYYYQDKDYVKDQNTYYQQ